MVRRVTVRILPFCFLFPLLQACMMAPFASSAITTATSTGFVQTTAINGASYITTGKGVSEHVISGVTDENCKFFNIIDGKSVCQAYDLNNTPQRDLSSRPTQVQSEEALTIEDVIQQSIPK